MLTIVYLQHGFTDMQTLHIEPFLLVVVIPVVAVPKVIRIRFWLRRRLGAKRVACTSPLQQSPCFLHYINL